MNVPLLDLKAHHQPLRKELLAALEQVLDKNNFILGNEVAELEEKIAAYCQVRFGDGRINKRFQVLMERLSKLKGWFVPVHSLLDHILKVRGHQNISDCERNTLERKWLIHKIINTRGRS